MSLCDLITGPLQVPYHSYLMVLQLQEHLHSLLPLAPATPAFLPSFASQHPPARLTQC